MNIQVPDPYLAGVAAILKLDDASADALVQALDDPPRTLNRQTITDALEPKLHGIPRDDALEIISVLISMSSVIEVLEADPSDFVEEVLADLRQKRENLQLPDEALEGASGRLNTLLRHPGLSNVSKARSILRDCPHAYCRGRVLTDVRPIFGDGPDAPPTAAVIVHTMRISYHERDEIRDFYLTLDSSELGKLKQLIDRAESKQKALEATLKSVDLPYISAD